MNVDSPFDWGGGLFDLFSSCKWVLTVSMVTYPGSECRQNRNVHVLRFHHQDLNKNDDRMMSNYFDLKGHVRTREIADGVWGGGVCLELLCCVTGAP